MSANRVLVTGASGNVGYEVANGLLERGESIVAALSARHFESSDDPAAKLFPGVEPSTVHARPFDFTDESTWGPVLEDVDRVFLMRPPHISNIRRDMAPFLDAIARAGIGHVSFLSVQGAENNSIVPHHKVEQEILARGLPHSFIRPSFFMQNLTTTHLQEIRDEHRILVPAGDGATNFVDVRDIGEAVAATLAAPPDESVAYAITGDEELTYYEVADRLSAKLPFRVDYEPAGLFGFFRYNLKRGRKLGQIIVMYALYTVTRMGKAGTGTPELRELLGRPPRSIDQFIEDNRERFLQNG